MGRLAIEDMIKALKCVASQNTAGDCYADYENFRHMNDNNYKRLVCRDYISGRDAVGCPYYQREYGCCFDDGELFWLEDVAELLEELKSYKEAEKLERCAMNDFREKVVMLLKKNNMTQRELANKVGITEVSLSRYISGKRIPKGPVIANIANVLHTTANYLLGSEAKGNEPYSIDQNIILKSIDYYGEEIQSTVCMEECAELIQAVSKMIRESDKLSDDDYDHLAEEIADVLICVEMLKQIYDIENLHVKHWIERKQKRILNRMEARRHE